MRRLILKINLEGNIREVVRFNVKLDSVNYISIYEKTNRQIFNSLITEITDTCDKIGCFLFLQYNRRYIYDCYREIAWLFSADINKLNLDIRVEFICLNEVFPSAFLHISNHINLFFTNRDRRKYLIRGLQGIQIICRLICGFCIVQCSPNV